MSADGSRITVSRTVAPEAVSRFVRFDRAEWAALRANTPLTLTEDELRELRGLNERVSLQEVEEIYLPLSRLLNLYVAATQQLHRVTETFLGSPAPKMPYVIAIAGSVAVGKSTTARILQALLGRWPDHPTVDLVTTDGFLLPNRVLETRGLMKRKGFPESYDRRRLVKFLADAKAGRPEVLAPVYSHEAYDIVPGGRQAVRHPDIIIIEGLNVLQTGDTTPARAPKLFVSDLIDFSIYVDADACDVEHWYVQRFLTLRDTVFQSEASYFHRYAGLSEDDAVVVARGIWHEINAVNLVENILPTRERAHLILRKAADHSVQEVRLRKL